MRISTILYKSTKLLRENKNPLPRLDAEVLLASLLNVDRTYLIIYSDHELEEDVVSKYNEMLIRRLQGEPIAYITGHQEFMGLDFVVNEHVLIPRPDTEILVEYVINYCKNNQFIMKILDIGTGSGSIALSIGKNVSSCELTLLDISQNALDIAKLNAERIGISNKTRYLVSDCFTKVGENKFNIIVSNPPYIPTSHIEDLQIEVSTYEPRRALDGGEDGLIFYRRIIHEAKSYLFENGLLAFEIGYNQGKEVAELFRLYGYGNIRIIKDFGGNDRVVVGNLLNNNK